LGHGSLFLEVNADVTEIFFDFSDGLEVGRRVERVASKHEQLDHVLGHVAPGYVESSNSICFDNSLEHRNDMGDSVSRIKDRSSLVSLSHESQESLVFERDSTEAKLLDHDLSHLFSVLCGVKRRLSKQNFLIAFVFGKPELLVKAVFPEDFHIVPVEDSPFLKRILNF